MTYPTHNDSSLQDYGIPVAPPHGVDIVMNDTNVPTTKDKEKRSKSRSPGKRVVYYHGLPTTQVKTRIGKPYYVLSF